MSDPLEDAHRQHWATVVSAVARSVRDLDIAEEATAEAFATAVTRWPHRSSAAPTTRASNTSGCDFSAASTSSVKIFSPPELMHIEPRPSSVIVPSASHCAKSPATT